MEWQGSRLIIKQLLIHHQNPIRMNILSYFRMKRVFRIVLITALFILAGLTFVHAQKPARSFGVGFHAGDPTGLSLQFYREGGMSADVLLAYDFDQEFFANLHGLWNSRIDRSGHLNVYYGPGAYVRVFDYDSEFLEDEVRVGLSGTLGLSIVIYRIELFGQATPRLDIAPGTRFDMGGGIGLRVFF